MEETLALAAGAAWLLVFAWLAAVTALPPLRPGTADLPQGLALAKPALVNLSVTRCRLNGAAYSATILDLAARGHLAITEREPGQLWCDVPAPSPATAGLASSDQLVLTGVRALAGPDGAPYEALAESCASDVRGRWDPFERAVRAEGRRAGITRPRLPLAVQILLYAGAAAVCVLAFAAVNSRPHTDGVWAAVFTVILVFILPAYWARSLARQDRLTGYGSAVGAWAVRAAGSMAATWSPPGLLSDSSPAGLSQLAWVVAAGIPVPVPGVTPGVATGVRPGRARAGARTGISGMFVATPRPSAAWSSVGGQWRMVRISPLPFRRTHPVFWLVLAAWLALMAYVCSLLPGPADPLVATTAAAGSLAAAAGGVRGLARWLARPAETSFQGQVIARWVEHRSSNDDDSYIPCIAVDDGERSWSFDLSGTAFGQLALGDTVTVRASPRSGKLLGLVPGRLTADAAVAAEAAVAVDDTAGGQQGAATADALLTAQEVAAAVGRPVHAVVLGGRAASVLYRGEDITIIVTAAEGLLGSLSSGLAQRRGTPLPGIGDEAWLLNRDRTVVFRAGGMAGKVTIGGSAARSLPPDVLIQLATTLAERLPERTQASGPSS
jgi:hypothetical protein